MMCQEGGAKKGGNLRSFGGLLTEDFEDGLILAVMTYHMRVKWTYPEGFVDLWFFLVFLWKIRTDEWTNVIHYKNLI